MAIGNWGTVIVFEVSSRKILNFQNLKRSVSGRWKKHSIIGKKPRSEFTGPESSSVSMDVVLAAEHGVRSENTDKQSGKGRGKRTNRVFVYRRKENRKQKNVSGEHQRNLERGLE